jgi:predicted DNA-binding transcriptional regulator AlpA
MENLKIDPSKLVTITDYAKKNGVTRPTVYNWIKDSTRVPPIKVRTVGGRRFIEL